MKYIYIFLFILSCSSCSHGSYSHKLKLSEKQKLVNKLRKKVSVDLQRKYGLIPFGTGGQMMNKVEKLMLIFNFPTPLTENQARVLAVNAAEDFIQAINEEETLRQYLSNYPFGPKNVPETKKYRIVFKETFEEAKYKIASQQQCPLSPPADNLE